MSADSIVLETVYGEDEGLPGPDVLAIEFDRGGDLLAGTRNGLGRLRPGDPGPGKAVRLRLDVVTPDGDAPVLDARGRLPHDAGNLVFDYSLLNYYREEDTRYRTELVGGGEPGRWSEEHSTSFSSLAPGRYVFRVWARDYRGQVTGPAEFAFAVRPPPWRSPLAIAGYAIAGVLGLVLLFRRLTRAARRRTVALQRSEREARASERKFRALFERAFDAHLLVDGGVIAAANASAAAMLGVSNPTELEGRDVHQLVPALPRTSFAPDRRAANALFEVAVFRDDGRQMPAQVATTPVPLEDGRHLVHLVLRDLSRQRAAERERADLEQQMQEAQKLEALGTLAEGLPRFQQPVTVIRGTRRNGHRAEPPRSDCSALGTISTRATVPRLVRQILTFSRRSQHPHASLDLRQLLQEMEPLLRSSVSATVRIELNLGDEPMLVVGDSTQLQQMILNLCTNAEYAMREHGGMLVVALDRLASGSEGRPGHTALQPGRYVRLVVRDTGRGMAPDVLARVFEPFYTTKPVGEGTGLGLAVLHGVVASHHGSVTATSVLGQGTAFEILLPAARVGTGPQALPQIMAERHEGKGGGWLLRDDDPAVLGVTQRLLRRLGYEVTGFGGPEARCVAPRSRRRGRCRSDRPSDARHTVTASSWRPASSGTTSGDHPDRLFAHAHAGATSGPSVPPTSCTSRSIAMRWSNQSRASWVVRRFRGREPDIHRERRVEPWFPDGCTKNHRGRGLHGDGSRAWQSLHAVLNAAASAVGTSAQTLPPKPAPKADAAPAPSATADRTRSLVSGNWLPSTVSARRWERATSAPMARTAPPASAALTAGMICIDSAANCPSRATSGDPPRPSSCSHVPSVAPASGLLSRMVSREGFASPVRLFHVAMIAAVSAARRLYCCCSAPPFAAWIPDIATTNDQSAGSGTSDSWVTGRKRYCDSQSGRQRMMAVWSSLPPWVPTPRSAA